MIHNIFAVLDSMWESLYGAFGMSNVHFGVTDLIEIFIITVLFYYVLVWIKTTRAWNLFKGIIVILVFVMLAALFQMNTILWLARNTVNILLIALVIIFQPELRSALESLGGSNIFGRVFDFNRSNDVGLFSDKTREELIRGCFAMGRVKTGALIVIENEISLDEFVRTGIDVDGIVTSQLLINIFEKNTPLHDGAVIVRGDRIISATCYLPLTDSSSVSKNLGTRHRAAIGVSEVTDSMTLIVSEETGHVSVAYKGQITEDITADELRLRLQELQNIQHKESSLDKLRRRFLNASKDSENSDQ